MLGKPVEEEPEAALLNQKFDDERGGRGHEAEEEDDDEQVGWGTPLTLPWTVCKVGGWLHRRVALQD